jgi:hypothetical protein
MSELHLKRPVACPSIQARTHLEHFFAEHDKGDGAVIALRASLGLPGFPALNVERDCLARLSREQPDSSMIQHYRVAWASASGGPFPRFEGTLSIPDGEDYTSCWLALDGHYEPPLGVAGEVFDLAIGQRIAAETGNDLLTRIGTAIEASYAGVEAAKAERRAAASSS